MVSKMYYLIISYISLLIYTIFFSDEGYPIERIPRLCFRDRSCASPYFIAVIAPVPEGIALASAFSLKSETVPISY